MQNSWIPIVRGSTVRQARVALGDLYEEHLSRQGFFGPATMLYHKSPIPDAVRVEGPMTIGTAPLAALAPTDATDPAGEPVKLLYNEDLAISISKRSKPTPFILRNIDADTIYFIHEGTGSFATEFGPIAYESGDLVYIPKGVSYRIMPEGASIALVLESRQPIRFTEHQQVGRHAPFDPTVLTIPDITEYDWPAQTEWEVRYKHGDEYTHAYYAGLPFDIAGWKGDYFPFKINIRDVRPITSERLHLAPSAWSIFEAESFMLVAFMPMSIVTDPEAEELPSRHRNVDSEEVVLIRKNGGVPINVLGHFPQAVTHGPDQAFREKYEAIRKPGMQRVLDGLSIDAYNRLKRTPAFAHHMNARLDRPTPNADDEAE